LQCQADLAGCCSDDDGDGIPDALDSCPDTPQGLAVDQKGCSQEQFCDEFDATTRDGRRTCKRSDWKNDEPVMRRSDRDCAATRDVPRRCLPQVE
jgi:hypothetical protein